MCVTNTKEKLKMKTEMMFNEKTNEWVMVNNTGYHYIDVLHSSGKREEYRNGDGVKLAGYVSGREFLFKSFSNADRSKANERFNDAKVAFIKQIGEIVGVECGSIIISIDYSGFTQMTFNLGTERINEMSIIYCDVGDKFPLNITYGSVGGSVEPEDCLNLFEYIKRVGEVAAKRNELINAFKGEKFKELFDSVKALHEVDNKINAEVEKKLNEEIEAEFNKKLLDEMYVGRKVCYEFTYNKVVAVNKLTITLKKISESDDCERRIKIANIGKMFLNRELYFCD